MGETEPGRLPLITRLLRAIIRLSRLHIAPYARHHHRRRRRRHNRTFVYPRALRPRNRKEIKSVSNDHESNGARSLYVNDTFLSLSSFTSSRFFSSSWRIVGAPPGSSACTCTCARGNPSRCPREFASRRKRQGASIRSVRLSRDVANIC